MLHGDNGYVYAGHSANLTCPQPGSINHMFTLNIPLICYHRPGTIRLMDKVLYLGFQIDFCAGFAG